MTGPRGTIDRTKALEHGPDTHVIELGFDVALFGLIGLLAGAHCIGMCGPLVTIYDDRLRNADRATRSRADPPLTPYAVRQHLLFNVGRVVSYALIGAVLGGLGGVLFASMDGLVGAAGPIRGVIGVAIGAVVIGIGWRYLRGGTGIEHGLPGVEHVTSALVTYVDRLVHGPGIMGLGAIHGVLPCPILYPAYLFAFASGSALAGAIALGTLGLGTIPAVLLFGTVIGSLGADHRARLHRLLGAAFLVLGYVLLAHGLASLGVHLPHPELPHWNPLGHGHEGH